NITNLFNCFSSPENIYQSLLASFVIGIIEQGFLRILHNLIRKLIPSCSQWLGFGEGGADGGEIGAEGVVAAATGLKREEKSQFR
ncbi:hypothetical protein CCACVL1_22660, partial [Corchorus capsularis]